ncbi:MAG: hypothetical protein MRY57_01395 [Candidatus Pacebacteria bacterium]|nr:hypothetical protein [Candidatus Paceibacterota bacterium]
MKNLFLIFNLFFCALNAQNNNVFENSYVNQYQNLDFEQVTNDTLYQQQSLRFSTNWLLGILGNKQNLMFYNPHMQSCSNKEECSEYIDSFKNIFIFERTENGVRVMLFNMNYEYSFHTFDIVYKNDAWTSQYYLRLGRCMGGSFIPDFNLNSEIQHLTKVHKIQSKDHALFVYRLIMNLSNRIRKQSLQSNRICGLQP